MILTMAIIPFVIGLMMAILQAAGIIDMQALVKIFSLYVPALSITLLLGYLTTIDKNHESNKVNAPNTLRARTIKAILKKWNEKKFNPLGFSWAYCEDTDSLELSIDADLEVQDEPTDAPRKSLKSS